MSDKIRVMIIDDSALMRNLVTKVLSKSSKIQVVGTALNGKFGLSKLNRLMPDVIVLDLEMPEMNGIEFLKERDKNNIKTPVVILSSHAKKGAKITLEALALGASDFVLKPSEPGANLSEITDHLIEMVIALGKPQSFVPADLGNKISIKQFELKKITAPKLEVETLIQPLPVIPEIKIIAIGISTGGPNALRKILPVFKADFPVPIVIVQHMPEGFTTEFAKNLDLVCPLEVKEAEEGDIVKPGRIIIAPGNRHVIFEKKFLATIIRLKDTEPVNGHRPSADVLFQSTAEVFGKNSIACIMTGMGKDGADQIGKIRSCGGIAICQDQESSVVFGMPRVAIINKNVHLIKSLLEIPGTIIDLVYQNEPFVNS